MLALLVRFEDFASCDVSALYGATSKGYQVSNSDRLRVLHARVPFPVATFSMRPSPRPTRTIVSAHLLMVAKAKEGIHRCRR
jgi:hypothetical protein